MVVHFYTYVYRSKAYYRKYEINILDTKIVYIVYSEIL